MGIVRKVKGSLMGGEAQSAWDRGDMVFTPVLILPTSVSSQSGPNPDWSIMIAAVLQVGWTLTHWSVALSPSGHTRAFPVFIRQ